MKTQNAFSKIVCETQPVTDEFIIYLDNTSWIVSDQEIKIDNFKFKVLGILDSFRLKVSCIGESPSRILENSEVYC